MCLHDWWWWSWFNEWTVQLRTLPLVPSPTRPHPTRGDSGACLCIHVCRVWSVFPTAFIVPHHLPVCQQLHTDSPAQLDSIWTCSNAHMRSESSSPTGDRTRVARFVVQCSTDWATPSSCLHNSVIKLYTLTQLLHIFPQKENLRDVFYWLQLLEFFFV